MAFPLSVLDLSLIDAGSNSAQALQNTIERARATDRLGYTRHWLAEHHNSPGIASSTPEVMIAAVARETTRIHVGSGGVMLPNHTPLKVVETFRILEALYPGRIDLGIGRAPGTDQVTALALRRSKAALGADDFPEQLAELLAFSTGDFPEGHPFQSIAPSPNDVELPPIWLLGSSGFSSQAAATLGLGFAFAHHINPIGAVEATHAYRENFIPSAQFKQPHTIITAAVICAETEERAEELATTSDLAMLRVYSGRSGPMPSPQEAMSYPYTTLERARARSLRSQRLIGTPASVKEQLTRLVERTQADEAMITTVFYGHENRLRAYELLAEAFDL